MRTWSLVAALSLASCVFAQEASPILHGRWTAAIGPSVALRGAWIAQALPGRPNSVHGSWTLLNENGQIVLEGKWSAEKAGGAWQGTWTARAAQGRSYAGTWRADIDDLRGKTFEQMLEWTAEKTIAGTWRSGGAQGNWWLKGSPPQPANR